MIEVANFQPSPCFWAVGDVQLVVRQHRIALGGECFADFTGTGGFAGEEGRERNLPAEPSFDLFNQGVIAGLAVAVTLGSPAQRVERFP